MNFALSEEHEFLRTVARTFVKNEIDLAPLLIPGATVDDAGYASNWKKIVEVGWPGLIVPEACGGSEMSCIDLAMVVGEMGRELVPSPFFGTLAATWTILRAASPEQRDRMLASVVGDGASMALAIADADGASDGPSSDTRATQKGDRFVLNGSKSFVVDAAAATNIVVAADSAGGRRFFVVDARDAGVCVDVLPWRDVTRQVCSVRFDDVEGEMLPGDAAEVWPWVRDRLLLVLSTESAAGIEHVLESTVAYAKERVAFGRPIGAYQAIKHALADTFGTSECANVATLYAAWALSQQVPDASIAAAMAQAYTSDAYIAATQQSIQIFGALGFSWEMKNHLYFKRARANATLLGQASGHRARVIDMVARAAA